MTWGAARAMFADRADAGRALAAEVARHLTGVTGDGGRPLVLALPRGGVPVAARVADVIDGDLDIVIARKIGAPHHPEYGVGALAEDGPPVFNTEALQYLDLVEEDLAGAVAHERAEISRRLRRYRGERPAPQTAGRTVVLVDDGLATGVTARAALRWLRTRQPQHVLLAVPVCSRAARDAMTTDADTVICLRAPEPFTAVGTWYADFRQLTDTDVEQILEQFRHAHAR
ncbi:phosphoribosyltransferase family protein [Dactylosporangium sp. NBC_01737]|uniref:phosphoribosyltransferase n=1 Tax=Dactylosporangium sp. NBC_01737 TaxID=2975959 RepID=UPI002E0FA370|nr:phosphoribosyltransferase family protein [Dactylosporangium sp. NBC_01737]